jgi:hypothetical protein
MEDFVLKEVECQMSDVRGGKAEGGMKSQIGDLKFGHSLDIEFWNLGFAL